MCYLCVFCVCFSCLCTPSSLPTGGHTKEMIALLQQLDPSKFVFSFALAKTDVMSMKQLLSSPLKERGFLSSSKAQDESNDEQYGPDFHLIQRPREVKQSYISSIFTTIKSCIEVSSILWFSEHNKPSQQQHQDDDDDDDGKKKKKNSHEYDIILMNGPSLCVPFAYLSFLNR